MENSKELLDASEDSLLHMIGQSIQIGSHAFPKSPQAIRRDAERWIQAKLTLFQPIICGNAIVRGLASSGFSSELVSAVSGLIESMSLGTAASPLAVLLCKRGLVSMCKSHWETKVEEKQ